MSSSIIIDFGEFRDFEKSLTTNRNLGERRAKSAMYDSVKKVQEIARREAPRGVSSPGLKNSIIGRVESWHRGIVGVNEVVKHARAVEYGTKPHNVDPEVLYKWVRLKLRAKNYRSVAYAVARKIGRRGTKAQPYMQPAFEQASSFIKQRWEQFIEDIILKV